MVEVAEPRSSSPEGIKPMAEEIVVKCENCGKKLKTEERFVGQKGRCPNCGSVIRISRGPEGEVRGDLEQVVQLNELSTRQGGMLKVVKQNDVGIISFRTSRILDQSNVQELGEELDDVVDTHKLTKIVINFENIHYMSSAVMGKLIGLHKKLSSLGGQLRLCNISDDIFEIFKIMRLNKLFKIAKSEDEAVIDLMG